jgi:hypothetical protein
MTDFDDRIYEITIHHRSKVNPMSNMAFTIAHTEKIEGSYQLQKVVDWLVSKGFEPDVTVFHAPTRAAEVIEKFEKHLHDWPVMRELQA